ncbi:MAG: hypothetical protein FWF30_00065 [Coriobacteriia bacterium]|nr:hypothetical protein [Coriobacteriia bacterium]
MRTCPYCQSISFDDIDTCYGCLHRFTDSEKTGIAQIVDTPSAGDHLTADIEAGLREFVESLEEDLDLLEPSGALTPTPDREDASCPENRGQKKKGDKTQEPEADSSHREPTMVKVASETTGVAASEEAAAAKVESEAEEASVRPNGLAIKEANDTALGPRPKSVLPFAVSVPDAAQPILKRPSRGGIARLQVRLPGGYHYDVLLEKPEGASLSIGWLPNEPEAEPSADLGEAEEQPQFG